MPFDRQISDYGVLQIEGQNVKLYSDPSSFISLNINVSIRPTTSIISQVIAVNFVEVGR